MNVLHGSKKEAVYKAVASSIGQSVLTQAWTEPAEWLSAESTSQFSRNIQSANVLVSRELSDQRVFGFAWKSI